MEKKKITNDFIVDNILYYICKYFYPITITFSIVFGLYLGISLGDLIVKSGSVIEGAESFVKYGVGSLFGLIFIICFIFIIIQFDFDDTIDEWYETR